MKKISDALKKILNTKSSPLCRIWEIKRTDGLVLRFTDWNQDLQWGEFRYLANQGAASGAVASNIGQANIDNAEFTAWAISSAAITENDINVGLYDNAYFNMWDISPALLSGQETDRLSVLAGTIGLISQYDGTYTAELRGIGSVLQRFRIAATSKKCRYRFGDFKCGVNLDVHTVVTAVTGAIDNRLIYHTPLNKPIDYFTYGKIKFLGGKNFGYVADISKYNNLYYEIVLYNQTPYPINTGDTIMLTAGCSHGLEDCRRFNNVKNYGGEPHIPRLDEVT